jgi:hypothetical protein
LVSFLQKEKYDLNKNEALSSNVYINLTRALIYLINDDLIFYKIVLLDEDFSRSSGISFYSFTNAYELDLSRTACLYSG